MGERLGAFREANGGTLLLDEICDMPLPMQAKILRTLQDKVVTPVGGRPLAVDVRIIAATHGDLPDLVAHRQFREDLYYRLNVVPITLAPLRERLASCGLPQEATCRNSSRPPLRRVYSRIPGRAMCANSRT